MLARLYAKTDLLTVGPSVLSPSPPTPTVTVTQRVTEIVTPAPTLTSVSELNDNLSDFQEAWWAGGATLIATIVGALIGALVAYYVAKKSVNLQITAQIDLLKEQSRLQAAEKTRERSLDAAAQVIKELDVLLMEYIGPAAADFDLRGNLNSALLLTGARKAMVLAQLCAMIDDPSGVEIRTYLLDSSRTLMELPQLALADPPTELARLSAAEEAFKKTIHEAPEAISRLSGLLAIYVHRAVRD